MTRLLAVWIVCAGVALSLVPGSPPAFEAASVKVAGPFQPGVSGRMQGGPGTGDQTRFTYARASLQNLLIRAYGVQTDQISAPDWVKDSSDDRTVYTVTAAVPPGTSKEQFNVMLQNLLAERFHLTLHHESKEFPGYDLVVAEGDPKIKAYVAPVNAENAADRGPGFDDKTGFPWLGPKGTVATLMPRIGAGWAMIRSTYRMSMAQFVVGLGVAINEGNAVDMTVAAPRVTDKTGLPGVYEFTLEFAGMIIMPGPTPPPDHTGDPGFDAATDPGEVGPSLFRALEQQLGLKLVKTQNVPVDILVIDHADKVPTEN